MAGPDNAPDNDPANDPTPRPPLFVVRGDASAEEVAALTAVLQGLAAATAPADRPRTRPQWSAPARTVRGPLAHGPGGWRASTLPR